MVSKRIVELRLEPYIKEACMTIFLEAIVVSMVLLLLYFAKFPFIVYAVFVVGFIAVTLLLNYRVIIQALIDKRKEDYVTEIFTVKQFNDEFSFNGNRTGNSYIRYLYPKDLHVSKMKIKVINDRGEEKKIRAVISFRQLLNFVILDDHQIKHLKITYLRRSGILINVDSVDDINQIASKKKQRVIQKALHCINTPV